MSETRRWPWWRLSMLGWGMVLLGLFGRDTPLLDWGIGEPWLGAVVGGAYIAGFAAHRREYPIFAALSTKGAG
jgi:hypothetical protein